MRWAMPLIYLGREETRREHLGGSTTLAMCFAAPISNRHNRACSGHPRRPTAP
jgi:hypothetical protein